MRACAGFLFGVAPHTLFLIFFFCDVCVPLQHPLPLPLRTRHFLFFSFWRVQCGSLGFLGVDPHTPFPTFSFLTCACPAFPAAPHTPFPIFFFFDVCVPLQYPLPLPLRTRHFLLFSFLTCMCPFSTTTPPHAISYFHAFYSRLFIFIHIFPFLLLTSVNIRDNMCANKNERRCFYVY